MAKAFAAAHRSLRPEGRFVVVFDKEPDAWETLVSAMIRAGFLVDASWPIMTERSSRMRSMGSWRHRPPCGWYAGSGLQVLDRGRE